MSPVGSGHQLRFRHLRGDNDMQMKDQAVQKYYSPMFYCAFQFSSSLQSFSFESQGNFAGRYGDLLTDEETAVTVFLQTFQEGL